MAIEIEGSKSFRHRIVLSTLLGQTIRVTRIRENDMSPGLRDYETDFLKLISEVTDGAEIDISKTGTMFLYRPGSVNGRSVTHACHHSRSLGYYIVPLLLILPFSKTSTEVHLTGVTNANDDLSVDIIRSTTIPLLTKFGIPEDSMNVKIIKRGPLPVGEGEVVVTTVPVKEFHPIDLTELGLIRSVRGVAYSTKISPQMVNRMGEAAKLVLSDYLQDVYITTDHWKGKDAGKCPGYGVTLTASSINGSLISTELFGEAGDVPEDIGQKVACMLLKEVAEGGCVDVMHQSWALIMMVICSENVSKLRLGDLTQQTVECLRSIKELAGVMFQAKWDETNKTTILSCYGIGFVNMERKLH
ncbi:RNA 3' terminal phosphate cyclase, putative [Entamoeba invadens IP1]|uniref:RNA 3' terminal phosphate cyclase, putative n=1 Tax=Entamoeba invadens IP1 TaxID=370355 RepID=A0A0A1U2C7_ENTIV|nr:RNA 3' terminal phosphate cyclase, putative [Entamoeba invadens IP1]ELP85673.1 RNA 3' terminal phosphate cyclase, putative [Entamoeba invadens IP1]|eukprot:XP_004185019.1 RNA 3' terminal phosphate cyclase, putative [Entamoeba invadens IP1]